jgi:hypothetical protein
MRIALVLALIVTSTASCATYRDQLVRSQTAFEQNDYERTLALLRNLEPDVPRLAMPERAGYAYLRGMTDYRIGYRSDARHWLSIARAYDDTSPGTLPTDWKARTIEALDELDAAVHESGYAALTTPQRPAEDASKTKSKSKP